MPIHDHSYQHWSGTPHDVPPALVLARAQIRVLLARRIVRFLLLVSIGFTLVWIARIYLETHIIRAGPLSSIASVVTVDAQSFRKFLIWQRIVHLALCLAAADLVALDRRAKALPLYFSRPLRSRDYIVAKAIAVSVPLSLATWVPAVFLILIKCILRGDVHWLAEYPWLPASVVAYAITLIVPLSLLTLALSSLSRSPRTAGATLFAALALSGAVGQALAGLTHQDAWKLLSVNADLDQVGARLFGAAPAIEVTQWAAPAVLTAIAVASIALLGRRIRAVDVIGGA